MAKNSVRLVAVLVLALASLAFAAPSPALAPEPCVRDTTWTDGNGVALVCYHCTSATYCYYN